MASNPSQASSDASIEATNRPPHATRPIPPIKLEAATWSKAGQLDWWVKEGGGPAGVARPGTRCRPPSTVDQSC